MKTKKIIEVQEVKLPAKRVRNVSLKSQAKPEESIKHETLEDVDTNVLGTQYVLMRGTLNLLKYYDLVNDPSTRFMASMS